MATVDLSDEEVDQRWAELVGDDRPEYRRITAIWNGIRKKYESLGERRSG